MTADRLRPKAESTMRFAAASGIEREIRMLQVADKIILDLQIALVDGRDERQPVHVRELGARRIMPDNTVRTAVGQTRDVAPILPFRNFLDGEIELVARDKIDGHRA